MIKIRMICASRFLIGVYVIATCVNVSAFNLTRLQKFYKEDSRSGAERCEELISYLKEEIANPSLPAMGLGGPIDSGYILNNIIHVMGQTLDRETLADARSRQKDPQLNEILTIALGRAGDPSVVGPLGRIARTHRQGYMRQAAARALGQIDEPSVAPILRSLGLDKYSGFGKSCLDQGFSKFYLVRQAAKEGLARRGEKVNFQTEVSLPGATRVQAMASLFEDQQPDVCMTAVQLLGAEGPPGVRHLKDFAAKYASSPELAAAVRLAEEILHIYRDTR